MQAAHAWPFGEMRPLHQGGNEYHGDDHAARFCQALPRNQRLTLWPSLARLGRIFCASYGEDTGARSLPGGRQRASRSRGPDGGDFRSIGGRPHPLGFAFDAPITRNGYAWWYLDAVSDDGLQALTVIAFIGSVFSPYYALARYRGRGDPLNHCAFNVALYGEEGKCWALTERTRHDLKRDELNLTIGPSSVSWDGDGLNFAIDERNIPLPSRIRGRIRILPSAIAGTVTSLDTGGLHNWLPIAPRARVQLEFEHPALSWNGTGYLDCNFGREPLERTFRQWDWSRAHTRDGTLVLYNVEQRDGSKFSVARRYDEAGNARDIPLPPAAELQTSFWRVPRPTRCDSGSRPRLIKTLEDTPFYARSLIETTIGGERVTAIHESLSLDRVANPIVRAMLPFRMPRRRYGNWGSVQRY